MLKQILISGGGTAGHLMPGIAVANELVDRGLAPSAIHFVGSARGPESELVPEAGYGVSLLPGRGIQRRLTPANIGAVWGLIRGFFQAFGIVRKFRPDVVLVLGGYASAAVGAAAVLLRVPFVVADQNARAGAVNRMLGRFASACAVPFGNTDLPRAVVTGNPLRAQVLEASRNPDPSESARSLGLDSSRRKIGVFSGSLGSRTVNTAVSEAVLGPWAHNTDLAIFHVSGARDHDDSAFTLPPKSDGNDGVQYIPVRYEDHIEDLLIACDLVVCRSGGSTVAELAVMGSASVLVPLPIATRDHQRANAAELVEAGAAVLVLDSDLDCARLVETVDAILQDPSTIPRMSAAARTLSRPDAAAAVADLLLEHGTSHGSI